MTGLIDLPLTINEGIYSSIASKIGHGGQLYRDAWDHKPPLVFIAYYIAALIFKSVEWQARCLVLLAHLFTAIGIVVITKQLVSKRWISLACASFYVALIMPAIYQPWSAQADLLMQPFLLAALSLCLSGRKGSWFWAGVFWAAAFYFKQSALFYLPLFVYLGWNDILGLFSDFVWGVNGLSLIVIAPFVFSGRLDFFWQAVMGTNGNYVDSNWISFLEQSDLRLRFLNLVVNSLVVYGLATLAVLWSQLKLAQKQRREGGVGREVMVPALLLACSLFACCVSGSFYPYYFVAILPALAIAASNLALRLNGRSGWKLMAISLALIAPETLAVTRYIMNPEKELLSADYSWPRMQAAKEVGEYIHRNSEPKETLVIWAAEPQIYSYSGLQFEGIRTPLLRPLALISGEEERFETSIYLSPPDWFVVGQDSFTPPLPDKIRTLLSTRFRLDREMGTKQIFRRI